MGSYFLGLDCSTQSLSAVLIDFDLKKVVFETAVNFDKDLPHYKTANGCLHISSHIKHSPPLMWVEALDFLFAKMQREAVPLDKILAVSGSAQQHGSVYLNSKGVSQFEALDPSKSLKENMQGAFSRKSSPIWMDAATTEECAEISLKLGGDAAVIGATGSKTFERFTGPQIRKFFKDEPENYADTAHIALVSSFMASLVAGKAAPIDYSDGSGMNLMDISNLKWHAPALEATAPHLTEKLPGLTPSYQAVGHPSPYFVRKYGLNPEALALAWSGDNPNSLVALGVIHDHVAAISLGTSFTYFGYLNECSLDYTGEGHLFAAPVEGYMSLICFKNGALALDKMRSLYSLDWEGFNHALLKSPPGNYGRVLLPYFETEIVPNVSKAGVQRFQIDPQDIPANCRGTVEAQMLSMRLHAQWMGLMPSRIIATGGASVNRHILQVMANVFGCPIRQLAVSKSAALGAALRAVHGFYCNKSLSLSWEEILAGFTESLSHSIVHPEAAHIKTYDELLKTYSDCEREHLQIISC